MSDLQPTPRPDHKAEKPWLRSYPVDIDWNMDIPVSTMLNVFEESVRKYPARTALNFMGKKYTYKELGEHADRFAKGLQQQGVVKGTRVGLCLPNTPFYPIAYFGAMKAGATVVNFNPLYSEREIEHQINDSGTELMVTINVKQVQPKVDRMIGRTTLQKMVVADLADALPGVKSAAFRAINGVKGFFGKSDTVKLDRDLLRLPFSALLENDGKPAPVAVSPDDVAVLQYTGGTTGVPKAAVLTHANLTANVSQAGVWFTGGKAEAGKSERMLAVLPFFHVFSMTVHMNLTLKIGGELIMLPRFDLKQTLKTIEKERPTIFAGVPTLYKAITDGRITKNYDLSSLAVTVSGGAALTEDVQRGWKALTGLELVEGYGLSETSPLAVANPVHGVKKLNSVGVPVPRTEVKIVSLEFPDRECPIKVEGEICLRGPQVMKEYWNKPGETAHVMDREGYFHTGDVGYMDDDGYVFIVDRIKDMINASGLKVFPRRVEEAILEHPAVSEVIVAGVQDEYRGETVKAYLVMRPGQKVTEKELDAFLRDRLAPYELPKLVDFRDSLPKTMIGKPDKKALREEEKARAAQKKPAPKGPGL